MYRGKNDALPEILFNPKSKRQFSRVIGFDLRSSALSCSLSTNKTPTTVIVFQDWVNGPENETLFPACIQYKSWPTTNCNDIKVGFEGRPQKNPLEEGDFYIPSIKDYVVQWITEGARDGQPDASLALKDYFQAVRTHLENAFKKSNEKLEKTQEHSDFQSKPTAKHYSLDDCQFCVAVPSGLPRTLEYVNLVRKAFVQAGFLKDKDDDGRLIFLDDVVAVGYSCITAAQIVGGQELETNYLVADIGYETARISVIQCQHNSAANYTIPIIDANEFTGYRKFSDSFRNYLIDRSSMFHNLDVAQPEEIDALVAAFQRYQKESKIDFSDETGKTEITGLNETIAIDNKDLRKYVFMPYLELFFHLIVVKCEAYRVAKVIFRAQYCEGPYFYTTCENLISYNRERFYTVPECVFWIESKHMASNGAVFFALETQIPSFTHPLTPVRRVNESCDIQEAGGSDALSEGPALFGLPSGHFAVGIDFGTTFSGCSYIDINNRNPGEKRNIETIDDWDEVYACPKTPTTLIYNECTKKFSKHWGFGTWSSENKLQEGDMNLELFKLLMSPEDAYRFYGMENRDIQEILNGFHIFNLRLVLTRETKALTSIDIIAEYLKKLNNKIKEYLQKKTGIKANSMKLEYVITVPMMWTKTGRAAMIDAAVKAGLIKSTKDKSIQLITELEAAALSYEIITKDTLMQNYQRQELVFTICDAGGGTVDLATFKQIIEKKRDGKEERRIEQVGDGTGGTCGAVHLDRKFKEVIVDLYLDTMERQTRKEDLFNHFMEHFKNNIKDNFMPSDRPNAVYRIPVSPISEIPLYTKASKCEESNDPDRPKPRHGRIKMNTVLEVSVAEVKRRVFDPVVGEVINLLKTHLVKTGNHRTSVIILVGGFSRSKYLQKRIQSFCFQQGISHVSAPPDGVTAISRGAVSYFLEPHLLSKTITTSRHLSNNLMKAYPPPPLRMLKKPAITRSTKKLHPRVIAPNPPSSTRKNQWDMMGPELPITINKQTTTPRAKPLSSIQPKLLFYKKNTMTYDNFPRNSSKYGEDEHLNESVDYSMYYYFIGIDIGSNSISCSYTSLYDQTEVHSITEWNIKPADLISKQESCFERYPTCVLYKGVKQPGEEILCGYDALLAPKTTDDLFIPNIKILLSNHVAQTQFFRSNDHGLTADKIVKDFMKGFLKQLRPLLLENICQDLQSQLAQVVKITSGSKDYFMKKNIEEKRQHLQRVLRTPDNLLDNSKFNIVCSANSEAYSVINDLICDAFVESGVFGPNFNSRRLQFTHSADAAAYTCLSKPRYSSKIKYQRHYLVCDIGYELVTFSKIATGSTALLSSVDNIGALAGAEIINGHFKNHLCENKTNYGITSESQIKDLVENFSKKNLGTIFDLSEEEESVVIVDASNAPQVRIPTNTLCQMVIKKFLQDIIRKLSQLYKESPNVDKIYVFGRYHRTQLFWEQVTKVDKNPAFVDIIISFIGNSVHDVSSGAVRHGINSEGRSSQLPKHDGFHQQETKFAEPPLEDFNIKDDFVLGIDLGNIMSGCSYQAPSKLLVSAVETWRHGSNGDEDGKIPTLLVIKDKKAGPFKILRWGDKAKKKDLDINEFLVEGMKLNVCEKDTTRFYKNNFFKGRDDYTFDKLLNEYPTLRKDDVLHLLTFYLDSLIKAFKSHQKVKKGQKIYIVLTVPSMWSTITRRQLIEKVIQERIVREKDKLKFKIISELEAAAIAYEPHLRQLQNSNTPYIFIMADIGGKTADVSTFQLSCKYDLEGNSIRTISSFNDARGGVCGASFLEKRFREFVADIYRDNEIVMSGLEPYLNYYAECFIKKLKKNDFKHKILDRNSCFEISLPKFHCELSRDRRDYNHFIDPDRKKLRILYRDINDRVFEPLVERITNLLRHQIKESIAPVDAIVLVGGFLNSTYLQKRISQTLPTSPVLITKSPECASYNISTCVSHGAALYFMNSQLLSHTYANQSYAMSISNKNDTTNAKALMCIVRKNDFVKGNIYHHIVHVTFPCDAKIEIYSSCETSILADSGLKSGELVPTAYAGHFDEIMTYTYAMPEVLCRVFKAGDKVALQVSFQITSQGDLDVKITLALDQETLERHSIPCCLKSFRI